MIYIPFIIRDPNTNQPIPSAFGEAHPSQIAKMWPGLKKGCCTDADNFHNIFLAGAPEPVKANLFGLAENACACIYTDTYTETLERWSHLSYGCVPFPSSKAQALCAFGF